MNWTLFDYAVAGALLAGVSGAIGLVMLMSRNAAYRAAVVLAALAGFMLIWSNLAVGIVGDPGEDANMLYFGTLGIALVGAIVSGFKARGMANAMFGTAIALFAVGGAVIALRIGADTINWLRGIAIGSGVFGAMFAGSGWLFLQAAKAPARAA